MTTVGVAIPSIPVRGSRLQRAVQSVLEQTRPVDAISISLDNQRTGAAANRNRALEGLNTEWVAFLDDDDELLPDHVQTLLEAQRDSGADVVWPWFRVEGGTDPFPHYRGRQYNLADPHQIPITVLVRRQALLDVGGFVKVQDEAPFDSEGNRAGEDYLMWQALATAGCKFHHIDKITWVWNHWVHPITGDVGNTSGLPSRW